MPLVNMIVDMSDYLEKEEVQAGNADIGYFEGSSTYIVVPDGNDLLENYTFSDYPDLEEVFVSKNITGIQKKAFAGCPKLKKIVVQRTVKTTSALYKNKPWGGPADCEVVFDRKAKPKEG